MTITTTTTTTKNKDSYAIKDNKLIQLRDNAYRKSMDADDDDMDINLLAIIADQARRTPISELQQKIITYSASLVREEDQPGKRYVIAIKDFASLMGDTKKGAIYERVYRELYALKRIVISFIDEHGDSCLESFLDGIKISKKRGDVSYTIPDAILPYYKASAAKNGYTRITLLDYMQISGRYAVLLYELLRSWQSAGTVTYTINEIRRLLDVLPNIYPRTTELIKYVINSAVDEINSKSNLMCVATHVHLRDNAKKRSKSNPIVSITFTIKTPMVKIIDPDYDKLHRKLCEMGTNPKTATELLTKYGIESVANNIAYGLQQWAKYGGGEDNRKGKLVYASIVAQKYETDMARDVKSGIISPGQKPKSRDLLEIWREDYEPMYAKTQDPGSFVPPKLIAKTYPEAVERLRKNHEAAAQAWVAQWLDHPDIVAQAAEIINIMAGTEWVTYTDAQKKSLQKRIEDIALQILDITHNSNLP